MYDFQDWGLIPYKEALEKQLQLVNSTYQNQSPGTIVFCTHPPVVTCGRATSKEDLLDWTGEIIEISRGGRATYHGPSQLVVYPIINLKLASSHRPAGEVVGFLRQLENSIVLTLQDFDIQAIGRSLQKKVDKESKTDETGVWVEGISDNILDRKVASLGIAVKQWVTYHGAAINIKKDPLAFTGIRACGFQTPVMISLEEKLIQKNKALTTELENKFKTTLKTHLINLL